MKGNDAHRKNFHPARIGEGVENRSGGYVIVVAVDVRIEDDF